MADKQGTEFKPVTVKKGDETRTVRSAAALVQAQFDGFRLPEAETKSTAKKTADSKS